MDCDQIRQRLQAISEIANAAVTAAQQAQEMLLAFTLETAKAELADLQKSVIADEPWTGTAAVVLWQDGRIMELLKDHELKKAQDISNAYCGPTRAFLVRLTECKSAEAHG